MKQTPPADFATILGATVHDMKNSLWLLLQNINQIAEELGDSPAGKSLADVQYEAQRLNTSLVQLLSLYRNESTDLPLALEAYFLDELFEELLADAEFYAARQNIQLHVEVADNLTWFMDKALVAVVLQDVLINALRYAHSQVWLYGYQEEDQLVIRVRDDGAGYPTNVLHNTLTNKPDIYAGRTGLGLYFARRIAAAHQRRGSVGTISITNAAEPDGLCPAHGGIFTLQLP